MKGLSLDYILPITILPNVEFTVLERLNYSIEDILHLYFTTFVACLCGENDLEYLSVIVYEDEYSAREWSEHDHFLSDHEMDGVISHLIGEYYRFEAFIGELFSRLKLLKPLTYTSSVSVTILHNSGIYVTFHFEEDVLEDPDFVCHYPLRALLS